MRRIAVVMLVAAVAFRPGRAQGQGRASAVSETTVKPLTEMVRLAVHERFPAALAAPATGRPEYLWLIGDGRGRISEAALDRREPAVVAIPMAVQERYPNLPIDQWIEEKEAAFGFLGLGRFLPGEVTPDTLYVFWAEPPAAFDSVPPPLGPYRLGLATAEQITPDTVKRRAAVTAPGTALWYVYDDSGHVRGIGPAHGNNPDISALEESLRPRFPGGDLTCSTGLSVRRPDGTLVRVIPIRFQARAPTPAG